MIETEKESESKGGSEGMMEVGSDNVHCTPLWRSPAKLKKWQTKETQKEALLEG